MSICRLEVHPTVAGAHGFGNFAAAQIQWRRGAAPIRPARVRTGRGPVAICAATPTSWSYQADELSQLIALPDSGLTPAQQRRFVRDVKDLDRFFTTPGLYL